MKSIFIAGTDTEVGKTFVTTKLLQKYKLEGRKAVGLKPIASGSQLINGKLLNDDVLALQKNSGIRVDYQQINLYSFAEAIAPHIAAHLHGCKILAANVKEFILKAEKSFAVDSILIEGAGGWLLPLNTEETLADLIIELKIPVILVVGIKVGCLNHAMLTMQELQNKNVNVLGWIANCIQKPNIDTNMNISYLKQKINAPCLDIINFEKSHEEQF